MSESFRCVRTLIARALHHYTRCQSSFTFTRGLVKSPCSRRPFSQKILPAVGKALADDTTIADATSFTRRTHLCGELRESDAGQEVVLCGWLQFLRQRGGQNQFLLLRDWNGITQVVLPEHKKDEYGDLVESLRLESVLEVKGTVLRRPEGQTNEKMATGDIEVLVSSLQVLNSCQPQLPFYMREFQEAKESLRMEHRYLDLRRQRLQRNLRLRSKMVMKMREFLANRHEFVEVETPTLFRRTPGGAKEFVVPSHLPGKFYSLPQSPQQFKQLLMVGGIDRYFQIARCYRDEGSKPDRQPEFTQVDVEMSFVDSDNIISLVEAMLHHAWPEELGVLETPFPQMTYVDAMTQYGCDKPDTRLPWKLVDVSSVFATSPPPVFRDVDFCISSVQALRIPLGGKHLSNKDVEGLLEFIRKDLPQSTRLFSAKVKPDRTFTGSLAKQLACEVSRQLTDSLTVEGDDIVFFCAGPEWHPHTALNKVRLGCVEKMEEKDVYLRDPLSWNFLWVRDFPLFLPREDGGEGLESAHHPFTAPHPRDENLLYTDPEKVRGLHYDLVLNGQEVGGGSIRIHNAEMQRYILEDILKEDVTQLQHLLSALDSGCPPHGGIALGLDRLVAIACSADTIRHVIAFPKFSDGKDPVSGAPAPVPQEELNAYHIRVNTRVNTSVE